MNINKRVIMPNPVKSMLSLDLVLLALSFTLPLCIIYASFGVYCVDPDKYAFSLYGVFGYYMKSELTAVFC